MDNLYLIITFLLLLPGIFGILLPILPGLPYMFLISFLYAWLTKFQIINSREILILAVIALISLIIDHFAGLLTARLGGATKQSLIYGLIGSILGLFFFPPLGSVVGLFLGIFLGEITSHQNQHKAIKAASAGVLGSLAAILIDLVLAIIFLVLFLVFALN
jgi:uncharacterized protein YqgC (DUF456 family)